MSEYIEVKDNKIIGHYCGEVPVGSILVPDGFLGSVGMDVREFDANWNPLPLSVRVKKNFVTIPDDLILDGEEVRVRTVAELVSAGLVSVDKTHKLVGESIVEKTDRELVRDGVVSKPKGIKLVVDGAQPDGLNWADMSYADQIAAGEITQQQGDLLQAMAMRVLRAGYFHPSDEAHVRIDRELRLAQAAGNDTTKIKADLAAWDAYAQALSDIPSQSDFPWTVTWPVRPDKVSI